MSAKTKSEPAATILIVDDTPDNIEVLFDFLIDRGFKVLVGENGKAALEALEVDEPDLILLDVMMPGIDGFETCRQLKAKPAGRDVPIFFMTALDEPFDKVRGLEAGAVDYITKPVYPEEVFARIKTHLEIRQLQKRLQEQNDRLDAALQRSITAEQALDNLLDRAVIIVREPEQEILFSTQRARELIAAHGGEKHLLARLRADLDQSNISASETLELQRATKSAQQGLAMVTLRPVRVAPQPADLKSLGITPRETEILFWIAQGKTNPEIATILGMQLCTVKKHVVNFLPKLGVETRLAAALRAHEILG